MALDEKKKTGRTIAGIGGALGVIVVVLELFNNGLDILDRVPLSKKDKNPTEPTVIIEETQEEISENITEAQIIDEEISAPETEALTEPAPTEPPFTYLDSLKIADSYHFKNKSSATDSIGNKYIGHLFIIGTAAIGFEGKDDYATYYLGGKYETLSGIIAISDDTYKDQSGKIEIYSDDNLIYNTDVMERISEPVEFSVSVQNCRWLKISQPAKCVAFILSDWKLQ